MRRPVLLAAIVLGALLSSVGVLRSSEAAFSAHTSNAASTIASTSIALSDNRSASALLDVSGIVPGQSGSSCIRLGYAGPAGNVSSVRLSASATITTLASALELRIDLGSGTATDCADFTQASGGIANGTVAQLIAAHPNFATGLALWTPTTSAESRTLRFTYTLPASSPSADQGKTVNPVFTFEVRTT